MPASNGDDDAVSHASTIEDEADDAILLRRSVFRVLGATTDSVGRILGAGLPLNTKGVELNARRMTELAPMIREAFALDTRGFNQDTFALDRIWTDTADFNASIDELGHAASSLEAAARARDPVRILRAVKTLLETCDACHGTYRRTIESAEHLPE